MKGPEDEDARVAHQMTLSTIVQLLKEGRCSEDEIADQIRRSPVAVQYLNEAEEMGFARGFEEGIAEGRKQTYRDVLETKYGFRLVFPAVATILANASREDAQAVLEAEWLEDLPSDDDDPDDY